MTHLGGDKQIVDMSPSPPICLFFTNVLMVLNCSQVMLKKSSSHKTDQDFLTVSCGAIYRLVVHFLGPKIQCLSNEIFQQFLKWSVGYLDNENTPKTLGHDWV